MIKEMKHNHCLVLQRLPLIFAKINIWIYGINVLTLHLKEEAKKLIVVDKDLCKT